MIDTTSEDAPLQAADPEDKAQNDLIEHIIGLRKGIPFRWGEALRNYHKREISEFDYKATVRHLVTCYIMATEPMIKSLSEPESGDNDQEDYWNETVLGTMHHDALGELETFRGLKSILNAPNPLEYSYEVEERGVNYRMTTTTRTLTTQIDTDILMTAYRSVNDVLDEYGLGIDLEEGMVEMAFGEVPMRVDEEEIADSSSFVEVESE